MPIAKVALPIPLTHLFDYLIPINIAKPMKGTRVEVPFGNRKMIGITITTCEYSDIPMANLKEIVRVLDKQSLFSHGLWNTLHWAAHYYHYPMGQVFTHALPALLRQGKPAEKDPLWKWVITNAGREVKLESLIRAPKQQAALMVLRQRSILRHQIRDYPFTENILKSLYTKGLCDLQQDIPQYEDWRSTFTIKTSYIKLNNDQLLAVDMINNKSNKYYAWLLTGISSPGKIKVYLRIVENILKQGKQALILVPEINLTSYIITQFYKYFNAPIDVLHSSIKNSKRFSIWLRARNGENAIIIGTRSALFIPLARPGIIIVDEEHDNSYKQQEGWRYHARDLAVFRAQAENIPIVMGSETPALETLYNVCNKKYYQINLNKGIYNKKPALQQIIDLRGKALKSGLTSILIDKIRQHLASNNQVLLFLNRRGFSSRLMCHDCGWSAKCYCCDSYYTLHNYYAWELQCHHCDGKHQLFTQCSNCGSTHLITIGLGIEQLEQNLYNIFPETPILRIDRDIMKRKKTLKQHLSDIHIKGPRILVGTQILIKDYYLLNVTLVSLINIDSALFSTDFRAIEYFAQFYTKMVGCTGYDNTQAEILLQTYYPNFPLLKILMYEGYLAFAKQILLERKSVHLPPWSSIALFRAEDIDNQQAIKFLTQLRHLLENRSFKDESIWLMGPIPSLVKRRNGYWSWQLLLRHKSRKQLQQLLSHTLPLINKLNISSKLKWSLDVDPIN